MAEEVEKQGSAQPKDAVQEPKTAAAAEATPVASGEGDVKKKRKKSKKRSLTEANLYINATYNNTIVTITEPNGNVVCWASSGSCGFKGTRKATPYAASVAAETALNKAKLLGVERVHISIKGIGSGRDQALRAVNASGVSIESLADRTAVPHNGCRSRKARRV